VLEVSVEWELVMYRPQKLKPPINIKERNMRIAKEDIDVKMEIPGAVIRQQTDFG